MSNSTSRTVAPAPIIVAVDFEPAARAALITGARLAMSTGAKPIRTSNIILRVVKALLDRCGPGATCNLGAESGATAGVGGFSAGTGVLFAMIDSTARSQAARWTLPRRISCTRGI